VFGLLTVSRAVLPVLRRQRSGRVVNISSLGGFAASAGWGVYNATKFAVEGLSEAQRQELAPLGIDVTVVEPGFFRTDFLDGSSLHHTATTLEDYAETAGAARSRASAANHAQPGDPARAAAAVVDLAHTPEPPLRLPLGGDSVARIKAKLAYVAAELDRWRAVSTTTDHVSEVSS
jgi:NAD(P)-dependent dehydrogenase (short-subunit alcohol dehydrogenase family)